MLVKYLDMLLNPDAYLISVLSDFVCYIFEPTCAELCFGTPSDFT